MTQSSPLLHGRKAPSASPDLDRRQQLAGSRAERGESENPIVLADQCLELATRFAGCAGAKDRGDGELGQPVGDTMLFSVHFVQTDARKLGFDEQAERHLPSRGAARNSAKIVPDDPEIVERHMGERRASRAVPHRPHGRAVVSSLSFTLYVDDWDGVTPARSRLIPLVPGVFHQGNQQMRTLNYLLCAADHGVEGHPVAGPAPRRGPTSA